MTFWTSLGPVDIQVKAPKALMAPALTAKLKVEAEE